MTRSVVGPLAGGFLLIYGISAVVLSWWAYSVTQSAITSVRTFTSAFERERAEAAAAVERAGGILGRRDGAASGAARIPGLPGIVRGDGPATARGDGPAIARGPDALRDRLRGVLGGSGSAASATATPAAQATPAAGPATGAAQARDGLGIFDDLTGVIGELGGGWSQLGEGPLPTATLDRVELATNAVLGWMAVHGIASIVIGIVLLRYRPAKAPMPLSYAGTPGGPVRYTPDESPTLQIDSMPRRPYRADE